MAYNFKANKALYLYNSRLLGKQRLALKGPISTSSSRYKLIRDIGTDIGMDIETVIEWLLLYYMVPITTRGKLSLGYRRTEVVRDRRGWRDQKDSRRANQLEIAMANKRKERLEFKVGDREGDKTTRDYRQNSRRRIYIYLYLSQGGPKMGPLAVKLGVKGSTVRERQACIFTAG